MKQKATAASAHDKPSAFGSNKIRRGDILLFIGILALALLLFLGYFLFFRKPGAAVEVSVDGKVTQTLSLDQDTTYQIDATPHNDVSDNSQINILEIKDGSASIIQADCPDRLCVHQKKINKKGETLVCLPHKVVVTVISSPEEKELDGIAN